ncbi:MAG TPA: RT0821/Lpp0805 family surface protein [Alphaproteobacteria bacterium]|jgi:surface antigen|nr:RT0821/Lpp0805 family surface protein [Alphaproteobacteria bacterium]
MIRTSVVALFAASLLLVACQNEGNQWGGGETVGTLGGAAAGGLIGSQIGRGSGNAAATLAGVLLGGFVGNRLGNTVDESDRRQATQAEQRAYTAPVGQQITWNNPQNGNSGTITPIRDGHAQNGEYCREFQETIVVGGQQKQGYGTACQQPDGSWKIVSQ